MENQYEKKVTWTIKNFSSLSSDKIYSDEFVVGGSRWHLLAYPKGCNSDTRNWLSLYLGVADSEFLPSGWKRHAKFSLTVVNRLSEKDSETKEWKHCFDHKASTFGYSQMLSRTTILDQKKGFIVDEKVKIVAEVGVLEVVKKPAVLQETLLVNESINVHGFQVIPSQVKSVNILFKKHPDIASEFRPKNSHLRTAYLNSLLSLNEIMSQSPEELSTDDLADVYRTLSYVTKAGFKVDWLEKKLKEVGQTRLQNIEKELKDLKQNCADIEALLKFVESVNSLFKNHPDFASEFRPENSHLRTEYLNSILTLTEILCHSPKELTIDDLANTYCTLSCLTKAGFKLDWLENKLKEVGETRLQEIEKKSKEFKQICANMDALLEFLR